MCPISIRRYSYSSFFVTDARTEMREEKRRERERERERESGDGGRAVQAVW